MYRIRFHGRGGQGMKTASRMLGSALFIEGFEVQDAPRYGAERRGAPLFAYVRAAREPINERGVITRPDLVVVADETLVPVPAAGVMQGICEGTVLLIDSAEPPEAWRERLNAPGPVIVLPASKARDPSEPAFVGAECVGAAARLLGVVSASSLQAAIERELSAMDAATVAGNVAAAHAAFGRMEPHAGIVKEGGPVSAADYAPPEWTDVPADDVSLSGPAVHGGATSVNVRTGLWRTMRPVIDYDRCNKCAWVCGSFCPDNAINVDGEGWPRIDLDHCKGCMICVVQCPPHAIAAIPEVDAAASEEQKESA